MSVVAVLVLVLVALAALVHLVHGDVVEDRMVVLGSIDGPHAPEVPDPGSAREPLLPVRAQCNGLFG